MNYIWSGMIIAALVCGAATGRLPETVEAAFDGAAASVTVILSLAGVMCFWTGFLRIAQDSGAARFLSKLIAPVTARLFNGESEKTHEYISMNITANLLGTGNAATPMGIGAMKEMDRSNKNPLVPTKNMCMLVAVNTASIQLIPTTILALRSAAGSSNPAAVIVPVWAASAAGCAAAVIAVKLFIRKEK